MLRTLTAYESKIFDFMAAREYTRGHEVQLQVIQSAYSETEAEAGPNGKFCEFTQKVLGKIASEYEEVIQRAVDRYEDWASD